HAALPGAGDDLLRRPADVAVPFLGPVLVTVLPFSFSVGRHPLLLQGGFRGEPGALQHERRYLRQRGQHHGAPHGHGRVHRNPPPASRRTGAARSISSARMSPRTPAASPPATSVSQCAPTHTLDNPTTAINATTAQRSSAA